MNIPNKFNLEQEVFAIVSINDELDIVNDKIFSVTYDVASEVSYILYNHDDVIEEWNVFVSADEAIKRLKELQNAL